MVVVRLQESEQKDLTMESDEPTKKDCGLLPDEERHVALHCLRDGKWPREVVVKRNDKVLVIYKLPSKKVAKRLLSTLGITNGNSK